MMKALADTLLGAVFAACGIGIVLAARQMEGLPGLSVGPGLLPLIIGGGLVLFGAILAVQGLPSRSRASGEAGGTPRFPWFGLGVVAALAVYIPLLPAVGFIPLTVVLIALLIRAGGGSWIGAGAFSLAATILVHALFAHAFHVPLPMGLLG